MDSERLLVTAFMTEHPVDAARLLEELPADEAGALLTEIPTEPAGEVLRRMSAFGAASAIAAMNRNRASELVAEIPVEDASSLLRRLEPAVRDSVTAALPDERRDHLLLLLKYPEGTAGALMDPFVLVLPDDLTVDEALARVRRRARHVYFYIYVTDRGHHLAGVLDLRELLLSDASQTLASVMRRDLMKVRADIDAASIEAHPGWQEYDALPVVDERGVFVGAIRHRSVRRLRTGDGRRGDGMGGTMLSLAELYWIGIGGMLRGLTGPVASGSSGEER